MKRFSPIQWSSALSLLLLVFGVTLGACSADISLNETAVSDESASLPAQERKVDKDRDKTDLRAAAAKPMATEADGFAIHFDEARTESPVEVEELTAQERSPKTIALHEIEDVTSNDPNLADVPAPAELINSANAINAGTYAFAASTGAMLEDMSSGTTLLVAADQDNAASTSAPIGFDFWYDGVRQTLFSVNSNGLMRLGVTEVSTAFANGITTTTNMPQIAPYWDDLWIGNNGKVHYKVVGTAPTRKLVVEWQNEQIPRVGGATAGAGTFQAWLWESTGVIEFVYGTGIAANTTNGGYTVGLGTMATSFAAVTTSTNTVSYVTANNTQTGAIPAGTKYTFTPNTPTTGPGPLSFTAVGLNTMTLNWTDGSSNEFGYAIYRSVDAVNYDFIRQTAANATSSLETGLASNTTWYWKVVTVTEGGVSVASSGSQATTTGTVSGTKLIGPMGDFPTLTAALADIATNGLAGNVILELQSTYTSAGETFPLVISTLASPSNTVTIRPTSGATGLIITSATTIATIDLNGATNVILDGRAGGTGPSELTIANTDTSGVAVQFVNGASRNTIQYSTITGVATTAFEGVVLFSTSAGVTGNNNNTIDHCDVRDGATTPINGICSVGTVSTALINTGNVISNNNVYNFYRAGSSTFGIYVTTFVGGTNLANTGWTITNNRIFQTATRTYTTGSGHAGVLVSGGNDYTISGNVVGFADAFGTGTYTMTSTLATSFDGIYARVGPRGNNIQGNTVAGISLGTTNGELTGIHLTSGGASITGNTVGSGTGTGSLTLTNTVSGSVLAGIYVGAGATDVEISNNTIGSLRAVGTATANPHINAVQFFAGGSITCTNNLVGSNSTANSIQITSAGASGTSQQVVGILGSSTMPMTIRGNTIANLTNAGTGTSNFASGIYYLGTGPTTISQNTVHDISGAGSTTSSTVGNNALEGIGYVGTSPYGAAITQNTVYAISATNPGAVGTIAYGIGYDNPSNGTVTQNRVYDIRNASTGTNSTSPPMGIGILLGAAPGGVTVANNMISIGNTPVNTNTQFVGIMNSFSTNLINLHFNSIYVGGTSAAGSLPSFGFLRGNNAAGSAITTPVSIKNNIFDNVRTGGTGKHYAIGNVNTTPTTGWSATASNNNVLNSPSTSTVGIWGLTTDQTFAQWQTSSGGDGASYTGVPLTFTNVATADLHFICGPTGTLIESRGVAIPGLTIDYDNQMRPGPAGSVNGGGTAPDIGADEVDCVPGCTADGQCSDGNACNGNEVCSGGSCQAGTPLTCNDGNACTTDSCNNATGCVFTNNTAPCSDGNACNGNEVCGGGTCNAGTPLNCNDGNACTTDSCNPASGCAFAPVANGTTCNDGNACTQTDVCTAGTCGGSTITCNDSNACTADTCNPASGCAFAPVANGTTCNDGNACTQSDTCQAGTCTGANPVTCTALDQCHIPGTCDSATGMCSNPNAMDGTGCNDGDACTQTDTCQAGACTGANPITCTALDQCHIPGTCDSATGMCSNPNANDGTECNDNNACTQTDTCQTGACTGANPITCTALDQCHIPGTCDSATGMCSNPNAMDGTGCNDSDACTQTDTCQTGTCTGANPVTCTALDQCHDVGTCDSMTGLCSNPDKGECQPSTKGPLDYVSGCSCSVPGERRQSGGPLTLPLIWALSALVARRKGAALRQQ